MCVLATNMVAQTCRPRKLDSGTQAHVGVVRRFCKAISERGTHVYFAETRQPRSATVEMCCVGCLVIAARAPRPASGASRAGQVNRTEANENLELQLTSSSLALATDACVSSQHKHGHSEPQTAP